MTMQPLEPPGEPKTPNNAAAGFNSYTPFIMGKLRGIRAWRTWRPNWKSGIVPEPDYGVRSLAWPTKWSPGINTSDCMMKGNVEPNARCGETVHPNNPYVHLPSCPRRVGCEFPTNTCSCGFYAYHGPEYAEPHPVSAGSGAPRIVGLIDGWGRMVRGSRGFRSQYAQIVAFIEPETPSDHWVRQYGLEDFDTPPTFQKTIRRLVLHHYPGVPIFPTIEEMIEAFPLGDVQ